MISSVTDETFWESQRENHSSLTLRLFFALTYMIDKISKFSLEAFSNESYAFLMDGKLFVSNQILCWSSVDRTGYHIRLLYKQY